MSFKNSVNELKRKVSQVLSPSRFEHTLGVEEMAVRIGELCLPDRIEDLRVAAILHDVAKEIDRDELAVMASNDPRITLDDLETPAALHAFCGPMIIKMDFSEYANEDILSSVFNHTTANADISLFDEIIYLSDYIEKGRKYPDCVAAREYFFRECNFKNSIGERLKALHNTVYKVLDNTVRALSKRGSKVNSRTYSALKYFKNFE